jgi:conjugal transfer pilus assembly protein TraW
MLFFKGVAMDESQTLGSNVILMKPPVMGLEKKRLKPWCRLSRAIKRLRLPMALHLPLLLSLLFSLLFSLLYLFPALPANAHEDFDRLGPVYAIGEKDLLQSLHKSFEGAQQSGQLGLFFNEAKNRAKRAIENPTPVAGVHKTLKPRTYYHDPTIELAQSLTDARGTIWVPAGTRVNPLQRVLLRQSLMFFDGRDPQQVQRVESLLRARPGKIKPILIAGSPLVLMRRLKTRVYFDQQGHLCRTLGIVQVPALVEQENERLRIDEML